MDGSDDNTVQVDLDRFERDAPPDEERGLMDEPEFQAIQQRLETIREESGAIEVSANAALAKRTPVSEDVAEQLDEGQAAEAQERPRQGGAQHERA